MNQRLTNLLVELVLEEMESAELNAPNMPGLEVRNIYFDITPARLISRWIDESGIHVTGILSEETIT